METGPRHNVTLCSAYTHRVVVHWKCIEFIVQSSVAYLCLHNVTVQQRQVTDMERSKSTLLRRF